MHRRAQFFDPTFRFKGPRSKAFSQVCWIVSLSKIASKPPKGLRFGPCDFTSAYSVGPSSTPPSTASCTLSGTSDRKSNPVLLSSASTLVR